MLYLIILRILFGSHFVRKTSSSCLRLWRWFVWLLDILFRKVLHVQLLSLKGRCNGKISMQEIHVKKVCLERFWGNCFASNCDSENYRFECRENDVRRIGSRADTAFRQTNGIFVSLKYFIWYGSQMGFWSSTRQTKKVQNDFFDEKDNSRNSLFLFDTQAYCFNKLHLHILLFWMLIKCKILSFFQTRKAFQETCEILGI